MSAKKRTIWHQHLLTSDTWFQDTVTQLKIKHEIVKMSICLYFYAHHKKPSVTFSIDDDKSVWLFAALLLCHKYMEEHEQKQLDELLYIKKFFFYTVESQWVNIEMFYLKKIEFQFESFIESCVEF
jgi:hypothetical protein